MSDQNDPYDISSKLGDLFSLGKTFLEDTFKLNEYYLVNAVDQGLDADVIKCLKEGINPNKPDGLGRLALVLAVQKSKTRLVEVLLKNGADPNLQDGNGMLALVKATELENMNLVNILLQHGANPFLSQKDKVTAEQVARDKNSADLLKRFGSDEFRSHKIDKERNLHEQQKVKYYEQLAKKEAEEEEKVAKEEKSILEKYDFKEGNEQTAILKAIQQKDSEALRVLVSKTSSKVLNALLPSGENILYQVVVHKTQKAACFLLSQGANPFIEQSNGKTAFIEAVQLKLDEFVRLCLDLPDAKRELNKSDALLSPLFLAYQNPMYWLWFLKAGANPHWGGKMGVDPMIKAVQKGNLAILPVWRICALDLQAPLNGSSLLKEAVKYERADWLEALLTEGVEPIIDGQELKIWINENLPDNKLLATLN